VPTARKRSHAAGHSAAEQGRRQPRPPPPGSSFAPPPPSFPRAQGPAESIADRRAELGRLQGFVADNAALVPLVNRLPDELSHDIMVPFAGAAFFPGRLIHTNELLV
ncbi:unnamed protein product, partial [Urochloa humidicola]